MLPWAMILPLAGTSRYIPGVNTTTFNGTDAQTFDIQGTITGNLFTSTVDNTSSLTLSNAVGDEPGCGECRFQA
jgi:hypothetical protein